MSNVMGIPANAYTAAEVIVALKAERERARRIAVLLESEVALLRDRVAELEAEVLRALEAVR